MFRDPAHSITALVHRASSIFEDHFEASPNRAASAPGRVNIIGEHTDYNDGFVLPMAINRHTVMVARANGSKRCRVVAADLDEEMATFFNDSSISPGKTQWSNYVKGVIHQFIVNGHMIPSFDAVIASSIPVGGGLSSSAALEMATATLVETLLGIRVDPDRKARWCQKAEHEFVGMPCGIMDQYASAMGRNGYALLLDCRSLDVRQVLIYDPEIAYVIADTQKKHELANSEYARRRAQCEEAVDAIRKRAPDIHALRDADMTHLDAAKDLMDDVICRRARHVISENQRTQMTSVALECCDYETAGFLMNESHRFLRKDFEVSCDELDTLVELAREVDGVYGSRMTGGGFGGCTVTLAKADAVDVLVEQLRKGYSQRFNIEPNCFVVEPSDGASSLKID